MAAAAKTVLVTRSAIETDAMAWPAKRPEDGGVYAVDIRPLLKAEQIAVANFVALPINGLCVAISSSVGGLLVLTISGGATPDGSATVYRLQFVFSDTAGDIEVFQVSLPVPAGAGCGVPSSSRSAMRGPPGSTGPAGVPGRQGPAGPPGIIDGTTIQPLPDGVMAGDEVLVYRPGLGFFFIPATVPTPDLGDVVFAGQTVTFDGQAVTFGVSTSGAAPVLFDGQPVTFAGQAVTFGSPSDAVTYGGQPVTVNGQPGVYTSAPSGTALPLEYSYTQATPTLSWTINHNLGRYPSVRPVSPSGDLEDSAVHYSDANTILLTFGVAFSGTVYLS